jgi:HSP20 family protein
MPHDPWADTRAEWLPAVDILDRPEAFEVAIELCGVRREDISIQLEAGRLTVSGERLPDPEAELCHYRERRFGAFARAFTFRSPVEEAAVAARLEQGVLTLTIPKRLPRKIGLE